MGLQDWQMSFQTFVNGKLVTVLVQNSTFLAQIIKESMDNAIERLGIQVWEETLRRTQLTENNEMIRM